MLRQAQNWGLMLRSVSTSGQSITPRINYLLGREYKILSCKSYCSPAALPCQHNAGCSSADVGKQGLGTPCGRFVLVKSFRMQQSHQEYITESNHWVAYIIPSSLAYWREQKSLKTAEQGFSKGVQKCKVHPDLICTGINLQQSSIPESGCLF